MLPRGAPRPCACGFRRCSAQGSLDRLAINLVDRVVQLPTQTNTNCRGVKARRSAVGWNMFVGRAAQSLDSADVCRYALACLPPTWPPCTRWRTQLGMTLTATQPRQRATLYCMLKLVWSASVRLQASSRSVPTQLAVISGVRGNSSAVAAAPSLLLFAGLFTHALA